MLSPFPGMDPYLEGNLWTSFMEIWQQRLRTNWCRGCGQNTLR